MLAEALTHAGYKVKSSYTGVDGINEIKNNAYDLILLDIMLPYKSGDEIIKETREFSETPVIVINFSPLQTVHLVTCNGYFLWVFSVSH
ncbi:Response regulator ArlR [compost metagenome]